MKHLLNRFLRPFHAEIHGIGYLKKLEKSAVNRDAMQAQADIFGKNARVIFDVGANRGLVTRQYREMFPSSTIHAFEPFTDFRDAFWQQNPEKERIHLQSVALAEKEGEADFFLNVNNDTNSLLESITIGASSDKLCANVGVQKVHTLTLDKYCREGKIDHIDILKLDTQGTELAILKGSEAMLKEQKIGLIYTEAYFKPQYKDQPMLYDIASYLMQFGYYLEGIYDPYYNERLMLWCDAVFLPVKEKHS